MSENREIEVTVAMVKAGLEELGDHHYADDWAYVLECVYRAMTYASPEASVINPSK